MYDSAHEPPEARHPNDIETIIFRYRNGPPDKILRCDTLGRRTEEKCIKDTNGQIARFSRQVDIKQCDGPTPGSKEVREFPGPWRRVPGSCSSVSDIKVTGGTDTSGGKDFFCAPSMGSCAEKWLLDHKPTQAPVDDLWEVIDDECKVDKKAAPQTPLPERKPGN